MLLSTAMPTVSARPAKPVRVNAALKARITANKMSMFNSKRDVGHQAGEVVVEQHERRHEDAGEDHRLGALADRVCTQGGTGIQLADRLLRQRGGQAAGVEHVDQVLDLPAGEVAGDLLRGR